MKLSEQEYKELIANLEYLQDKVESCYQDETKAFIENLKKEYKKHIKLS